MKKISMILGLVALTLGIHLTAQAQFPFPGQQPVQNPVQTKPMAFYSIGADVSEIPANEARGTRYADVNGVQDDPLKIMARHGFNTIRLRLFVNPEAPGGYSREGFCGTASTIAFAKRIKAAGMHFALNFHYSDTWADPDKQYKPSAWAGLTGKELEDRLYAYTKETLDAFKAEGVAPGIVQVGNEISHGFVWPEGKVMDTATEENWAACMGLYIAGQKAVREVLPEAKLQVHLALGGENILCREFLDQMKKYGAEFDIIGLSYYEKWHETYEDMKANIFDLTARYGKPVCICEYEAGLAPDNVRKINDIVRSVPDGLGYGSMAWAPTRVLFQRNGMADRGYFAAYDRLKQDSAKPMKKSLVVPPLKREFKFDEPIIGADISWLPSQEDRGMVFSDNGVQKDVLEILKEHHFNWIRLRLFVDPTVRGGYSADGYCGLDQTIAMAKRIKNAGMKFLLDFHYTDNWADPEKQHMPESWKIHSGSGLEGHIYTYTKETVQRFIEEGVRPDMIQTGNELNNGFVWPQARITEADGVYQYESFCVMLRCATAGVRAADPEIPVMIHIARGGLNPRSVEFFDKIISRDVKFDVIGQSYYPKYHGTLEELEFNLKDLAKRYGKPVVVVEYQDYRKEVNEIVHGVSDGLGAGTFIWEATSPQWGGLFDNRGRTTDRMKIYDDFWNEIKSKSK
ncbi:MAG: glycosyl hydrolase 53 family protein [Lentisphaeria bacterium]|nr:glycosyl hydrolase 53 family protein [Lentisphaeria bacterium]